MAVVDQGWQEAELKLLETQATKKSENALTFSPHL